MASDKNNLNGLFIVLLVLNLFLNTGKLHAQKIKGIYLSSEDFSKGVLSYKSENGKKCKIKLYDGFYKPYINIKYNDSSYTFYKDSIFGYKSMEGIPYRFYNKLIYPILNPGEKIILYKSEMSTGTPKNPQTIVNYYFSRDANAPVLPLTATNLEKAFDNNKNFDELLEVHFSDDLQLIEYDDIHKMYKINRLLELSMEHKNN